MKQRTKKFTSENPNSA